MRSWELNQTIEERDTQFDNIPEMHLWSAVIFRTVDDALGEADGTCKSYSESGREREIVRRQAREWIKSDELQFLCERLHLGDGFVQAVRTAVENNVSLKRPNFDINFRGGWSS